MEIAGESLAVWYDKVKVNYTIIWFGSNETALCVDSCGTLIYGKVFESNDTPINETVNSSTVSL